MTIYPKHPLVPVDYVIDWGGALNGRAIAASEWHIHPAEPDGVTVDVAAIAPTATRARISGGMPGRDYRISGRATFVDGGTAARGLAVRVTAR